MNHANNDFKLTRNDFDAIITALPLVANANIGYPEEIKHDQFVCECIVNKLLAHVLTYSAEEIFLISDAIGAALDYLTGIPNDYLSMSNIDDGWKNELSQYLFTYNRLYPYFDNLSNELEMKCK